MANLNANANADANASGLYRDPNTGQITHGKVGDRWVPIEQYNQIERPGGSSPQAATPFETSAGGNFIPVATAVPNAGKPVPQINPTVNVLGDDTGFQNQMNNFGNPKEETQSFDQRFGDFQAGIKNAGNTGVNEIFDNIQNDFAFAPPDLERAKKGLTDLGIDTTNMPQTQIVSEYDSFLKSDDPRAINERNALAGIGDTSGFGGQDLLADDGSGLGDAFNTTDKVPGGGNGTEPTFLQKMFGDKDNTGFFEPVVGGILGAAKVGLGYKQFKQAGEALDFQKDAFNRNFNMQTEMINRRLGDRERARQLLQGNTKGADQAAKSYVEKYGVKNDK